MDKVNKTFFLYFIFIIIIIFLGIGIYLHNLNKTQNTNNNSLKLIIKCDNLTVEYPVTNNSTYVVYNWTHSVEGTPIMEKYKVTSQGLILVEARAKWFGAGHPYNAEEFNGTFTVEGDELVYHITYNIGNRLEIIASPNFEGNITVISNNATLFVCPSFTNGTITILNP